MRVFNVVRDRWVSTTRSDLCEVGKIIGLYATAALIMALVLWFDPDVQIRALQPVSSIFIMILTFVMPLGILMRLSDDREERRRNRKK